LSSIGIRENEFDAEKVFPDINILIGFPDGGFCPAS
jgi:hypothetical protein